MHSFSDTVLIARIVGWWACGGWSQLGLYAGNSPSSTFSTLRIPSFLSGSTFKSARLEAVISGIFFMFPEESLWSRFWNSLFGTRPDDSVIDLTSISTLGITTLCIAVKIASWTGFSTALTAFSTSFLILSAKFFSITWSWLALFSPTEDFPKRTNYLSEVMWFHLKPYLHSFH